jgi:Arc/MetJ-type ribon-helix-helix transcriptional regulator
MKRATITIPDDLEHQLDAWLQNQEARPSLTAVVQIALRKFLEAQQLEAMQYVHPSRPFSITVAKVGSGTTDTSTEHDRHLANAG